MAAHAGECRGFDLDMLIELATEIRERNAREVEVASASPVSIAQ